MLITINGPIVWRRSGAAARKRRTRDSDTPAKSPTPSASRNGVTTSSMNAGWVSSTKNAFGGQSVVHEAHGVSSGYASTNSADPT